MTDQIKTERLLLRPYQAPDADAVVAQIGDFAVSKWLTGAPHPYSRDDALAFFKQVAEESRVYAVTRDTNLIGSVSIMDTLGYWFGRRHWGRGYATEAARAVVDAFFAYANEPLESGYLDGNAASCRVLEKLGFVPNGTRQSECLSRQARVVNHRMILTRESWEAQP